jgi:hypothetical protein
MALPPIEIDSFFLLSLYLTGAISREEYLRKRKELEAGK